MSNPKSALIDSTLRNPYLGTSVITSHPIIPPNASRAPIMTSRLLIRPLSQKDLQSLYELRSQPEVMRWTQLGIVDSSLEVTQSKLDHFLPPNDTDSFNFAICLRGTQNMVNTESDTGEGDLIGIGGIHNCGTDSSNPTRLGWSEIGYMFRKEHWGRGYATEFLRAFLEAWKELPRRQIRRDVDVSTLLPTERMMAELSNQNMRETREQIVAIVDKENYSSVRVLEKTGFIQSIRWRDKSEQLGVKGDVELIAWLWV